MTFFDTLETRARALNGCVALAEGDDPRVVEASFDLVRKNLCRVTIVCPNDLRTADHDRLEAEGVAVVDPVTDDRRRKLAEILFERRKHKGWNLDQAVSALTAMTTMSRSIRVPPSSATTSITTATCASTTTPPYYR